MTRLTEGVTQEDKMCVRLDFVRLSIETGQGGKSPGPLMLRCYGEGPTGSEYLISRCQEKPLGSNHSARTANRHR